MQFAGLQKNSTIDYPGVLSAVLFTPGCNFDCYYCHNRHLTEENPELLDSEEIHDFLKKRRGLIGGIVISGGEASLQQDLPAFIGEVKSMGYKVKLDTNGSYPKVVEKLIQDDLLDYIAVDYKTTLASYEALFGFSSTNVSATFDLIKESAVAYELRTTMIPEITPARLYEMALAYPNLRRYALQLYLPQQEESRRIYTPGELEELAKKIRHIQPGVIVRA